MKLTEEQRDIVELVKQGKTNAFIAEKMNFHIKTIERKLTRIYEDFQVDGRISLIVEVLRMEGMGIL